MAVALRVLIVEDSEDDAALVLMELKRGGYEPELLRVETAAALSAALKTQAWDIIISDYILPQLNGIEALKIVRGCGIDVPFVVVSGKIGEETAVEAMKAGVHDYVMKDRLGRLVPVVKRELEEAEVRRRQKLAEKELQQHRAHLEEIYHHTPEGLLSVGQDNQIIEVNGAFIRMAGYPAEDVVNSRIDQFFEGREIYGLLGRKTFVRNAESVMKSKSGETFPVYITVVPIFESGQYVRSCVNVRDVSEIKMLEKEKDALTNEVIKLTRKIPLTGNEKLVFYGIVRHPLLNDIELSQKLKMNRSTITAIRNKLSRERFYSTIIIPNFSMLGCELVTVAYSPLNPLHNDAAKRSALFRETAGAPEQVCLCATTNSFLSLCISMNITDAKKHMDLTFASYEKAGLSANFRQVYFPLGISSFEKLLDCSSYLGSLFRLDMKEGGETRLPKVTRKLTQNEKATLLALTKFPSATDSELSGISKLPRPSISQARKRLLKDGFLNIVNLPNLPKLGSELLVFDHIKFDPASPPETLNKVKKFVKELPNCISAITGSTEMCTFSAYGSYSEYETAKNSHAKFYSDHKLVNRATSICPVPDMQFSKLQFAPLVRKVLAVEADF